VQRKPTTTRYQMPLASHYLFNLCRKNAQQ
jgi:hypothetical protein